MSRRALTNSAARSRPSSGCWVSTLSGPPRSGSVEAGIAGFAEEKGQSESIREAQPRDLASGVLGLGKLVPFDRPLRRAPEGCLANVSGLLGLDGELLAGSNRVARRRRR